jgi:hypothetical protein
LSSIAAAFSWSGGQTKSTIRRKTMGLFVSIIRYTPEQAEALEERWDTVLNGTAPKAVMEAFSKMKIINMVQSPQNGFSLSIMEVTDQTWLDGTLVCRYLSDVASLEIHPCVSAEDWLKLKKRLPAEQIPKRSKKKQQ